jgi:hypothetical protein
MITDQQWYEAIATERCPVCRHKLRSEFPHSDGCPVSVTDKRELAEELARKDVRETA